MGRSGKSHPGTDTVGTGRERERAALVIFPKVDAAGWDAEDIAGELGQLAVTAGAGVLEVVESAQRRFTAATCLTKGKAAALGELVSSLGLDLVIFGVDLAPVQQRNLEEITGTKVLDRTDLILDIFASRARTREGKLQVELAQLLHLLPRLVGRGRAMSRLGGGIGTRGPGEMKLEVDRRAVRRRITRLRGSISDVRKHRSVQRKGRKRRGMASVAIVGYTNSGKSTLLNVLAGAQAPAEDRLFATLDPMTRRVELPGGQTVLLTDTVGFIRGLPYDLVAAFKGTLEEAAEADLLVHVLDASHPKREDHSRAVSETLRELGCEDTQVVLALNKSDLMPGSGDRTRAEKSFPGGILISARGREGLAELLGAIGAQLRGGMNRVSLLVPYRDAGVEAAVRDRGRVIRVEHTADGIVLEADIPASLLGRVVKYRR